MHLSLESGGSICSVGSDLLESEDERAPEVELIASDGERGADAPAVPSRGDIDEPARLWVRQPQGAGGSAAQGARGRGRGRPRKVGPRLMDTLPFASIATPGAAMHVGNAISATC